MKSNLSIGLQLIILILSVFFCISLSSLVMMAVFQSLGITFQSQADFTPETYLIAGIINQVIGFFGGFLLFLKLTKQSFFSLIQIFAPKIKMVLIIIGLLVLSYPIVEVLAYFNQGLKDLIPNNTFIANSQETEAIQFKMLTAGGVGLLLAKIVVIGLITGISEELIFRGVLLTKIREASNNKHYAVLVSGLIFAIIHLQPLVLLPMFFLGIVLGYIYTETKNLSYAIMFHALFNSSTILAGYFFPEFIQ